MLVSLRNYCCIKKGATLNRESSFSTGRTPATYDLLGCFLSRVSYHMFSVLYGLLRVWFVNHQNHHGVLLSFCVSRQYTSLSKSWSSIGSYCELIVVIVTDDGTVCYTVRKVQSLNCLKEEGLIRNYCIKDGGFEPEQDVEDGPSAFHLRLSCVNTGQRKVYNVVCILEEHQRTLHSPRYATIMKWTEKQYPAIHMTTASRDEFPSVTLDNDATQKFAEIKVQWEDGDDKGETSVLIRGHKSAEYHIDAASPTLRKLRRCGLCATVTGGGRIKHDESRRSILVYGYSMQYGPADLAKVADMCREAYPGYEVLWTKDGY